MEEKIKFTIVVPVYNVESTVIECLESIWNQDYSNYDVVIVNDGSTDRSLELCETFVKNNCGVEAEIVTQKNKGLLLARREGFRHASGDFIVSVDSDDAIRSDALSIIASGITSNEVDVVAYETTRTTLYNSFRKEPPFDDDMEFVGSELLQPIRAFCCSNKMNTLCTKAVRRECLCIDHSYEEYKGLSCCEDQLQICEIFDNARSIAYLRAPIYYYRINDDSVTQKHYKGRFIEYDTVYNVKASYAEKWEKRFRTTGLKSGVYRGLLYDFYRFAVQALVMKNKDDINDAINEMKSCAVFRAALSELPNMSLDCRILLCMIEKDRIGISKLLAILASKAVLVKHIVAVRKN